MDVIRAYLAKNVDFEIKDVNNNFRIKLVYYGDVGKPVTRLLGVRGLCEELGLVKAITMIGNAMSSRKQTPSYRDRYSGKYVLFFRK